jgi:putative NIF3 family GTP cyclohydrolase 1 type 2
MVRATSQERSNWLNRVVFIKQQLPKEEEGRRVALLSGEGRKLANRR